VRILTIPYRVLFPAILFFICVGVYSVNNNPFDIFVVMVFGVIGYVMRIFRYPAAPLLMGFILGPMMEEHFRRALLVSRGDVMTVVERPISAGFLALAALLLILSLVPMLRRATRRGLAG
jgi:TctA family transporter